MGPDPRTTSPEAAVFQGCSRVLDAGRTALWRDRNNSYYVVADHVSGKAYLVIGSRAGELEAHLARLGCAIAPYAADPGMEDVLRRYCWMGRLEQQLMQAFVKGRP